MTKLFFLPMLSRYNTAKRADWENPFIYAHSSLQPLPNIVKKSTRGNIAKHKHTMRIGSQKLWVQEKNPDPFLFPLEVPVRA